MSESLDYHAHGDSVSASEDIDLLLRNLGKLPNTALFVWNEAEGTPIYISAQLPNFYGVSMEEFLERYGTNDKIAANMVDNDSEGYLAATRAGIESATGYEVEFRFYRADGSICFAREVGEYILDADTNRVLRSVGAVLAKEVIEDLGRADLGDRIAKDHENACAA